MLATSGSQVFAPGTAVLAPACGSRFKASSQFVAYVAPLLAVPYPKVDAITLLTTNAELADALAMVIDATKR